MKLALRRFKNSFRKLTKAKRDEAMRVSCCKALNILDIVQNNDFTSYIKELNDEILEREKEVTYLTHRLRFSSGERERRIKEEQGRIDILTKVVEVLN